LVYVLSCDAKKLYSFELPQDDIDELRVFTKLYTTQKLEKEYNIVKMWIVVATFGRYIININIIKESFLWKRECYYLV